MLPSAMTLSPTQFSYPYSLTSMTETTNFQAKKSNAGTSTQSEDSLEYLDATYDPTPYYLYDDTNGEPPISWQERRDAEFRKKYGWA